jgi:hypothetical protein
MPANDHPLFKQYPLEGQAPTSIGIAQTPYQIYDGYGTIIGGTADLDAVRALLKGEGLIPLRTRSGAALMAVWVCKFTDASLGPHHELQFSIFGSVVEHEPVEDNPLTILKLLLTRPDVMMMCHGLWNNSPEVVVYNREVLDLNAKESVSEITLDQNEMSFAVSDKRSGGLILKGEIHNPQRAAFTANFGMLALVGFGPLQAAANLPWLPLHIVNPVAVSGRNSVAESFTKNDKNIIRYFGGDDVLIFGDTPYRGLGFKPQFVQFMDGFKFVYLNPK